MTTTPAEALATPARLPRQVPYIIGNEACERFSFYGMRNILVQFLISSVILAYVPVGDREGAAKDIFHSFVIGVYFFPLLGGWLSDRFFGKYNTVLWFSLVYCAGHACLALFEDNRNGFYTGLFLIALGSGGIKPLVVSFVGDQFTRENKSMAKVVFDAFYWAINFGSFFASLLMPLFLRSYGPAVAFGIPGVLMFIATLIFWMGRKQYVRVPPVSHDPDSFMHVAKTALTSTNGAGAPGPVRRCVRWGARDVHVDGVGDRACVVAGGFRVRDHRVISGTARGCSCAPRVRGHRHRGARDRYRREHCHLQRREHAADSAAAVPRRGPSGDRLGTQHSARSQEQRRCARQFPSLARHEPGVRGSRRAQLRRST